MNNLSLIPIENYFIDEKLKMKQIGKSVNVGYEI